METKQRVVLGIGLSVCVLAGAGIEHLRLAAAGDSGEDVPEIKEVVQVTKTPGRVVTVRDEAAERAAEALRKRVAELEKALAGGDAASVQQQGQEEPPQTEASREEQDARRRQSWDERMERMKTEDPERYAEMQQRREEFRQRMEQRTRDRADFLDAVDKTGMTSDQRANHEKLLETVARVNELTAQMMQSGGRGRGEEGEALRQEMGESMMALGQLYDSERQYLLETTAKAAGYSGGDVSAFTEHIQSIIENTTMMPGMGGQRGGRGGGPGGGREGGGAPPR
jgi:hypothetical protein